MAGSLTHIDENGAARMVDVGGKPDTAREAAAAASVFMTEKTLALITEGTAKKGDVMAAARLAGIMAAKKTADLIPLCHPIALTKVSVDLTPQPGQGRVDIVAKAATVGPTGVEMEALTAASVAALTIYDMLKAVERGMKIGEIKLLEKSGGQSGHYILG